MSLAKHIQSSFEEIQPKLDEASHYADGGLCVLAASLGLAALRERGESVRIAGGRAAFSVNKTRFGMLDFGYSDNSMVGRYIGHFWLVHQYGIIDFSLPYLKETFEKDNARRGIAGGPIKLPSQMLIPTGKLQTYAALYKGKIGWHYQEIPGRGEVIDEDLLSIPEIPPVSPPQ